MKVRTRTYCATCSRTKAKCLCGRGKRSLRTAWGFSAVGADGKQVRTFKLEWTKEQAEQAAIAFAQSGKARALRAHGMTLAEATTRYLTAKSRKRSLAEDERILEHLKTELGAATMLYDITGDAISKYRERRLAVLRGEGDAARPLSAAAVNRPLALLRHLLKLAREEWEAVADVPRIRLEREPQGRLRWLSPEEATRLLNACRASKNPELVDVVTLALFTGCRRGELLALTWDRVDRARGVIRIEHSKGGRRREVPLTAQADAALVRRGPKDTGPVFTSQEWDTYRSAWEAAVRRAKPDAPLRFHDLRHTCASWLVQRGATLAEVRAILGHQTLAMTMRYAHLAPEHLRVAAGKLEAVLGPPAPAPAAAITHDITHGGRGDA